MVIAQLVKLLGQEAANYLSFEEQLWADDPNTHADYTNHIMPHQNNGHPIYDRVLMDGSWICQAEKLQPILLVIWMGLFTLANMPLLKF